MSTPEDEAPDPIPEPPYDGPPAGVRPVRRPAQPIQREEWRVNDNGEWALELVQDEWA